MMNNKIAALSFAGVLLVGPLCTLAAEKTTAGAAVPPNALPGVNHPQSSRANDEKANKKGEEASGSNSGAQSHETEKDAASSSDSKDINKAPEQSRSKANP